MTIVTFLPLIYLEIIAWKKIFRSPPSAPSRLSFCASVQVSRDSFPDPRVRHSLIEEKYENIEGCEQSKLQLFILNFVRVPWYHYLI